MGKSEIVITIILFNVFFILFIGGIIAFIKQYKLKKTEHMNILNHQNQMHQKEILETQIEIQNQTMQHIGREIHDNVGQKLTLASLYTQQLAFENKAPHINENIENISKIINESLSDLRELSKSLTDDNISQQSICDLIANECDKVKKVKKITVNFNANTNESILNYQQKSIIYRISQEFIQNSLKYSKCTTISINLTQKPSLLLLELKDNGIGFDTNKKSNGIGLENMRKRTLLINGTFDLFSNENTGTKLIISIPINI